VGGLAAVGMATSTRRGYVSVFKGFFTFLLARKAAEIEALFGERLIDPVDEFNAARRTCPEFMCTVSWLSNSVLQWPVHCATQISRSPSRCNEVRSKIQPRTVFTGISTPPPDRDLPRPAVPRRVRAAGMRAQAPADARPPSGVAGPVAVSIATSRDRTSVRYHFRIRSRRPDRHRTGVRRRRPRLRTVSHPVSRRAANRGDGDARRRRPALRPRTVRQDPRAIRQGPCPHRTPHVGNDSPEVAPPPTPQRMDAFFAFLRRRRESNCRRWPPTSSVARARQMLSALIAGEQDPQVLADMGADAAEDPAAGTGVDWQLRNPPRVPVSAASGTHRPTVRNDRGTLKPDRGADAPFPDFYHRSGSADWASL
jgi:hypothetical protein